MRQYGAPAGNPWESDSEIVAAKARAVEDRTADEEIAAGVEDHVEWRSMRPCGVVGCEVCGG